jgi:glycosyltransferase involved in cell wall biosynthesis
VFALSSLREGLPNVLLEAMAYEAPVVSTDAGGVSRLIQNEQNGLVVPVDDVPSLTKALARMLTDQTLSQTLTVQGRQTIEERFSFRARMDRVCAVYEELLSR